MPITVALDRNVEDPRPYIERAHPTHPSLIDSEHRLADLYHIINVPTMVWIDEAGRVVRPNDSQFGTDTFVQFHGKHSAPFLAAVRINSARGCRIRSAAARRQLTRRFSAARYEKRIGETKNAFICQPGMHGQSQPARATPQQIARQTGYRARIRRLSRSISEG